MWAVSLSWVYLWFLLLCLELGSTFWHCCLAPTDLSSLLPFSLKVDRTTKPVLQNPKLSVSLSPLFRKRNRDSFVSYSSNRDSSENLGSPGATNIEELKTMIGEWLRTLKGPWGCGDGDGGEDLEKGAGVLKQKEDEDPSLGFCLLLWLWCPLVDKESHYSWLLRSTPPFFFNYQGISLARVESKRPVRTTSAPIHLTHPHDSNHSFSSSPHSHILHLS